MSLPILQTKFFIPRSRANLVQRDALLARLLAEDTLPITLISAPAGFGKTTLVCEWIQTIRKRIVDKPSDATPITAWLSLDENDNDPIRFFTYLIAALQRQQPTLGVAALELLAAPQAPPFPTILTLLLNEVSELTTPIALVLDDFHLISAPAIHDALTFLLDHLPPTLRLIITSRSDPPLPLARWRVRGQLHEIRAHDLRFNITEAAVFLQQALALPLTHEEVAALTTRTEGWIAALQMAALSLEGRQDHGRFIAAFTGSHRFVIDYLTEEVLRHQPEPVRQFLLATSILERVCGSLSDALTQSTGGQATLEQLEQSNLFLIPLDDERRWYRYHHLFAEVLRLQLQQTQPQAIAPLHQRASGWCEQHELWPEAIHHALAAADYATAARLIERVGITLFSQPTIQHSLQPWLSALPASFIRARPRLCLMYAWIRFAHADSTTALQWVTNAEATLRNHSMELFDAASADEVAAEAVAMRTVLSAYNLNIAPTEVVAYGRQALAKLSENQYSFRGMAASGMGMAYLKQGDVIGAEEAMAEANRMSRAAGNPYIQVAFAASQVTMQRARGSWRRALATCHENLEWLRCHGAAAYPTLGSLYMTLADLLREQNELEAAHHYAETAIAHSDQELNPSVAIFSRLALIRVKQAQGDWPQVWLQMEDVSSLIKQHPNMLHSTTLPAIIAQFQLAEGVVALETVWARMQHATWEEGPFLTAYRFIDFVYLYEHNRLARAQVYIAWARQTNDKRLLHETLAYLQRQEQMAEASNLGWYWIKLRLLQALTYDALGAVEEALAALSDALHRAEPEAYVRIFVDEGEPLQLLILDFRLQITDPRLRAYADHLLAAFGDTPEPEPSVPIQNPKSEIQNLIEPLTDREREILRLVADGLSNSEIADKLIVTVGTVKKHLNNIYGKLGVATRTQAIARARAVRLIE